MSTYSEELKNAAPTVTITPVPLIFEKPGEKWRGMYIGMKTWEKADSDTGEIKSIPTAHFFDGEKVLFNMGTQLTRTLADLPPGVSIEISLSELKPNKHGGGKTKIYAVTPLNLPVQNLADIFGGLLNIQPPAPENLIAGQVINPDPTPEPADTYSARMDAWVSANDAEAEKSKAVLTAKR